MDAEVNYNHLVLSIFYYLLKYEEIVSIKVDDLHEVIYKVIEKATNSYEEDLDYCHGANGTYGDESLKFRELDFSLKLEEFLEQYADYFYFNDEEIFLVDEVSVEDIETFIKSEEKIGVLDFTLYSEEIFDMLGIFTIKNIINNYLENEKKLEEDYNKLSTELDNQELRMEINELLNNRSIFQYKFRILPKKIKELFIYFPFDDIKTEYKNYPIDIGLWLDSDLACEDDSVEEIDDKLYDIFQYAVFGNYSDNRLHHVKFDDDIKRIYSMCSFIEMTGDDFVDDSINDEEWIFYLVLLKNINNHMLEYGKDDRLEIARKRLLYLLDSPRTRIFDEENFNLEFNSIDYSSINDLSFEYFLPEYYFIADEVFATEEDENTMLKLLLLSTYYELTHNEDIVKIINVNFDDKRYDLYSKIVFGDYGKDKTYTKMIPPS